MPRATRKRGNGAKFMAEAAVLGEPSTMVVRITHDVFLHNTKAKKGEVVTVDRVLGEKLIGKGLASAYQD